MAIGRMSIPLHECYRMIDPSGVVLDVGCWGFRQVEVAKSLGLDRIRHFGVDYSDPAGELPAGYQFRKADLNIDPLPFGDDTFDLVIASHVIEHLNSPVDFFGEMARVCRPGGMVYVEAPSERSLWLPGMPFQHDKFFSLSFFDDPTHTIRPWTPQALHRLARYFSLRPLNTGRLYGPFWFRMLFPYYFAKALLTRNGKLLEHVVWSIIGWSAFLIARKPEDVRGRQQFRYYIPDR